MSLSPDPLDPLQAWLAATRPVDREPAPSGGPVPADTPDDEHTHGPTAEHRLSRRLLRATALACIVALALGIASWRPTQAVPAVTPAVPGAGAAAALPADAPTAPPVAAPPATAATGAALPPDQAAAAVTAVRLATPADRYVDTAVAESAHPAGSAVIITVRAVVLDQVGQEWANPHVARYAVALSAHDPAPLTNPWLLPTGQPNPPRLPWQPAPTLRSPAQTALAGAGYRSISDVRVRRSDTLPDIVSALCRAAAPGDSIPRRHEVWLTADAAHVLGLTNASPPIPVPGEQP